MSATVLQAASSSDLGRRQVNQDRVFIDHSTGMFVVADGMGGHRGGATAAEMAVATIAQSPVRDSATLIHAVKSANQAIFERSQLDPDLRGMGTTITALALVSVDGEERLAIANVGDSRAYRLRAGELELLTEDHNIVSELVRGGQLSAVEARNHRQRSVLTRAVGVEPAVEVDVVEVLAASGDRYLLCSDGLTGDIESSQIAGILRKYADPAEACRDLIRVALDAGSKDNISAVIVDVVQDGRSPVQDIGPSWLQSPTATHGQPDVPVADDTLVLKPRVAGRAAKIGEQVGEQVGERRPRGSGLLTARTIAFAAALAAIGAIVFWAITNAPKDAPNDTPITASSTVPTGSNPLDTTVPASGVGNASTTLRPTLVLPSTTPGAPTTGPLVPEAGLIETIPVGPSTAPLRTATSNVVRTLPTQVTAPVSPKP